MQNEFYKYATKHAGLNSNALDQYMRFTSRQASTLDPRASYINPSIIEERQLNVAQMDVFSRLMMDRIIFLGTEIDEYSANVVQAQLLFLASTESDKDITMYLNSPGGIVSGGLAIYDTMQYISCDVSTVVTGMAASMASVLLAAGTKGKRFARPHSRVMIHQPLGGTQGQASDIKIQAEQIIETRKRLNEYLAQNSGQPIEVIERDTERDHWMSADEAMKYGLIDQVVTSR